MGNPYLPPVDRLLTLDTPEFGSRKQWPDYLALGITAEHVPELIRMLIDGELYDGSEEDTSSYGPIHAWRALGQLRAEAAIGPLVAWLEEEDWAQEEVPTVLGMIGPAAFEPLRAALARWSLAEEPWSAGAAGSGLVEIAQRFPEMRDAAVEALTRQLRWWPRHDPVLNSMLIHDLVDLTAVEAAPVIEAAFAADAVEIWHGDNDWEDVQVKLGLLAERITPKPAFVPAARLRSTPDRRPHASASSSDAKRRRKAGKAARRRNRKRR